MPNGIWAGMDDHDRQVHIDEIAAEQRDYEAEARDELAAEKAEKRAAGLPPRP